MEPGKIAEISGESIGSVAYVVWRESAGAYLSLMTALTPEAEELNGDVPENVKISSSVTAIVDFYGSVEFYTMDEEYVALGKADSTFSTNESFESKLAGQAIGEDRKTAQGGLNCGRYLS